MSMFDIFRPKGMPARAGVRNAVGDSQSFNGLDDPALLEFIRNGQANSLTENMCNTAVLRSISLICESFGMLPFNLLVNDKTKALATDHPVYRLLKVAPNSWQTPYEFKSGMQLNLLQTGHAYARIVRAGTVPRMLLPLDPKAVDAKLNNRFQMEYTYTKPGGGQVVLKQQDVLHVHDLSADGVTSLARMRLANNAISLARDAEKAASNVFRTGNLAGGAIEFPAPLSDVAYKRLRDSLDTEFSGTSGAKRLMLLEEGGKLNTATTSSDAQQIENRNYQLAEIARIFGIPRPLMMMDETAWGSGIQQLAIFFLQYGLAHYFTSWEQAVSRDLLSERDAAEYAPKVNEHALLRGTLAEQSDYFSKALGAGGSQPWVTANEVRDILDMAASSDPNADKLSNPMTQKPAQSPTKDNPNDPAKPA